MHRHADLALECRAVPLVGNAQCGALTCGACSIATRIASHIVARAIFIPFCDGLVILKVLGFAPPIFIHWGTALYMAVVATFLFKK